MKSDPSHLVQFSFFLLLSSDIHGLGVILKVWAY